MPDRDRGPALSSLGTRPPADLPWDARPAATVALPPPVPPAPRVVRAPTAVLAPSAWPPSPAGPCGAGGGAVPGVGRSPRAELGASSAPSSSSLQDAVLNACYRGCRLFSICHFVDASAALNTTRAECEAGEQPAAERPPLPKRCPEGAPPLTAVTAPAPSALPGSLPPLRPGAASCAPPWVRACTLWVQDGNGAGFPRDFWGKGQLRDGARAWGAVGRIWGR